MQFGSYKLVYRRYAGLFFTIAVDINDNELVYLETIHLFVELLDKYFSKVCELDIVFNFNKVRMRMELSRRWNLNAPASWWHGTLNPHPPPRAPCFARVQVYAILDEFILAGEIQETSKMEILGRIRELEKRERD
jgi:AP-2 complex subunit sigma-1